LAATTTKGDLALYQLFELVFRIGEVFLFWGGAGVSQMYIPQLQTCIEV
jgi:predicted nucleotidyltransferase component of viral defense system